MRLSLATSLTSIFQARTPARNRAGCGRPINQPLCLCTPQRRRIGYFIRSVKVVYENHYVLFEQIFAYHYQIAERQQRIPARRNAYIVQRVGNRNSFAFTIASALGAASVDCGTAICAVTSYPLSLLSKPKAITIAVFLCR